MSEEVKHAITNTDQQVRGRPGTVSWCVCGWSSAWGVQDGSAECDGDVHMRNSVPGYAEMREEEMRVWLEECEARYRERVAKNAAVTEGEDETR